MMAETIRVWERQWISNDYFYDKTESPQNAAYFVRVSGVRSTFYKSKLPDVSSLFRYQTLCYHLYRLLRCKVLFFTTLYKSWLQLVWLVCVGTQLRTVDLFVAGRESLYNLEDLPPSKGTLQFPCSLCIYAGMCDPFMLCETALKHLTHTDFEIIQVEAMFVFKLQLMCLAVGNCPPQTRHNWVGHRISITYKTCTNQ